MEGVGKIMNPFTQDIHQLRALRLEALEAGEWGDFGKETEIDAKMFSLVCQMEAYYKNPELLKAIREVLSMSPCELRARMGKPKQCL